MTPEFTIKGKDFKKAVDQDTNFRILSYNNPESVTSVALMEAINRATDPFEAQSLAYKIIASAELFKQKLIPSEQEGTHAIYGQISNFDGKNFRIDLLINLPDKKEIIIRFLAKKEKISKDEYFFIEALLEDNLVSKLFIIHQAEINPLDDIFFKGLSTRYPKLIVKQITK